MEIKECWSPVSVPIAVFDFIQRCADRLAFDLKQCMQVRNVLSGKSRRSVCAVLREVKPTY